MDDESKDGIRDRGVRERERMRIFLGCKKPPKGVKEYDFTKGDVRFEYKHSSLHASNKKRPNPNWKPTKRWVFADIWGDGGNKDFDYLILEGDGPDTACSSCFLIAAKEVRDTGKNTLNVTLPMSAKTVRRMRGVSRFVWNHKQNRDDLKSKVDRLASEGAGRSPTAAFAGESDNNGGKRRDSPRARAKPPRSGLQARRRPTSQLPLPFRSG